jgi:molybdopterin/thiamine biosynthesis adenylyltransferase
MIIGAHQAPEHFQIALEPMHSIEGCRILDVWQWYESSAVWALRFQLDIGADGNSQVPSVTEWFVLVSHRYPLGRIRVMPAMEHGLTGTFQHQRLNRPLRDLPWTGGEICTDVPGYLLDRLVDTPEPFSISERLSWHINKAKEWVKAAAMGDLTRPGEHFELPDFCIASSDLQKFAFSEGVNSIARWATIQKKTGLVRLLVSAQEKCQRLLPQTFMDLKGQTLVDVQWGDFFKTTPVSVGGWVLLPQVPVLPPWQAPATWAELYDTANTMGVNLVSVMTNIFGRLRDGQPHLLLIGFPIPEVIGGVPFRMHWQALSLPRLSTIQDAKRGFRPTNEGAMRRDLEIVLSRDKALKWLESDNWDRRPWGSRGRLHVASDLHTVIIGLGAIGSAVAEMLVRGGVENIVLVDGDEIEPGNLVRHTLTLSEEGKNKASALADRLNRASPYARVDAIACDLNSQDARCRKAIEQADLVIDCTANYEVLAELHAFSWRETTTLVSLAIGINAEKIYIYAVPGWSFSANQFKQLLDTLIQQDYNAHPDFELPQEDAGCWHPLFPARCNDIWFVSSLAVSELENLLATRPSRAELRLIKFDGQLHREVIYPNDN